VARLRDPSTLVVALADVTTRRSGARASERTVSAAQARRIFLGAQGFGQPRPPGRVDKRHVRRVFQRLGVVQLDSVNVLVRSHYLPFFSRLGRYDRALFDKVAYEEHEVFEYWAHEASLVDIELQPYLRWRMASEHRWSGMRSWAQAADRKKLDALHAAVLADGPISAGELDGTDRQKGPWWGWGDTKRGLEHLFYEGRVAAMRRGNFERVYCDPAIAVPTTVLDRPTPPEKEAQLALLEWAARAYGVGTAKDLIDFFRLSPKVARPLVEELADEGVLERVTVEGWKQPAFLHVDAKLPRKIDACALVSPFDSAMWERERIERLFDFSYRIEIYTPKPKRTYGYYVLPFLLGDRYVGRVDLKSDRAGSKLLVQAAWAEPQLAEWGYDDLDVAERLTDELRLLADWLALEHVEIMNAGTLSPALRAVATG
jgi:uncharacterized protein